MATDGTTKRRRQGTRASALAVSIALLAGCAGGGGDSAGHATETSATASTGPEPELASAPTTWDDGYDHVVVLTENAVTGGAGDEVQAPEVDEPADPIDEDASELTAPEAPETTEAATLEPAEPAAPPVAEPPATTTTVAAELHPGSPEARIDPASSDEVLVVHPDGSTELAVVPDGSLTKVFPRTRAESALLGEYADEPLAIMVADEDGVVGPAGRRYVMVPGRLIEVSEAAEATSTTTAGESADDASDATGATDAVEPGPTTTEAPTDEPGTDEPGDEPGDEAGPPAGPPSDESILEVILDLPGIVEAQIVAPGVIAVVTAGDRAAIRKVRGVVSVEDDTLFDLADDPEQSKQWAIENTGSSSQAGGWSGVAGADSNVKAAWSVTEGSGITVAVVDSGVDIDHPDLASNIWTNTREVCNNGSDDDGNGFVDDCRGWDFGANDNDPRPESGTSSAAHGTHVAGLIGAPRNGAGIVGIAPQAKLMALKVAMPGGQLSTSAIYSAIVYAADNGAEVINLSLGTNPGTPRSGVAAMEQAVAYAGTRGVTVVAAAGNSGVDIGASAVYPANFSLYYPHVITIGATTNSDTKASFSNYGSPVNLYAPGFFMWSTIPGSWGWMSGTSMATPVVSGAVADLLATGQVVTPSDVRTRLVQRADTTSAGPRLDVGSAVGVGLPPSVSVTYGGADGLRPDTISTLSVQVAGQRVPADVTRVQLSLAALVGGQVYAVSGLPVTFDVPGVGSTSLTSADDGSFAPMTLDPSSLALGWTATADVQLPAGQFAIVTELLGASGSPVGGTHLGYVTVADPAAGDGGAGATTTTAPGAPDATGPVTSSPATTVPGGGGGGGGGGTATTQPGTGTTLPQVGTTLPGGGGGSTGSTLPQVSTTTPVGGGTGGGNSTLPQVPTTTPSTPTTNPGASPTTSPSPTPTTAPPTATTAPSTPTTAPGSPATTTPVTTPTPAPDSSGQWRLDAMTPRSASIVGGTAIELQGRFPTTVPVYVWFGDTVVEAQSFGTSLFLRSPVVNDAGVVDVSVKFRTTTNHTLTLSQAFTFVAPTSGGGGATTTTSPSSGGGTATTQPGGPATTAPSAGPTPTTPSSPTTPTTPTTSPTSPTPISPTPTTSPSPGTTAPGAGSPAPTTTMPTLGSLSLRPRPSSGALSRVSAASWPSTGCRNASCPATTV